MAIHPKQVVTRQSLGQIANGAGAEVDNLLKAIDQETQMPLRMRVTADRVITIDEMIVKTELADNRGNVGSSFQGYYDASAYAANDFASKTAGDYYIIDTAGTAFGTNPIALAIGDYLICNTNTGGTHDDGADFGRGVAGSDRSRTLPPINGQLPIFVTGTLTIPTAYGSNVTNTTGGPVFNIDTELASGWTDAAYVRLGVNLNTDGQLEFSVGEESLTEASATMPAVPSGLFAVGHIILKREGTDTRVLAHEHIIQYVGGGSGSGGSGSGGINYISNFDFEANNTTGWATYDDGAVSAPVDGTGGSPSTLTLSANSTTPLRGNTDFKIVKSAADGQGEGWSYDFSIDAPDTSKKLKVEFDYNTSDAAYAAGDVLIYVYDVTNSTLITPSSTSLPAASGTHQITFDSSTSTSYRLIFHVATTNASAYSLYLDNIIVGPGVVVQGAAVGNVDISTMAANGSFGAVTNEQYYGERIGSLLKVRGSFKCGTVTAGTPTIVFPAGLTIDTTRISSVHDTALGLFFRHTSPGAAVFNGNSGTVYYDFSDGVTSQVRLSNNQDGAQTGNYLNQTGTMMANGDTIDLEFTVPIAEWQETVNLGPGPDVEYAYNTDTSDAADTTSFGYGPAGGTTPGTLTAGRTKRVRFKYPIQETDVLTLEMKPNADSRWIPVTAEDAAFSSMGPTHLEGSNRYGFGLAATTQTVDTDVDVFFGQYAYSNGGAFGSAGVNWTTAQAQWRVRKSKAGAAVGFGLATSDQAGLVSGGTVPGKTDGTATAAGFIGERKDTASAMTTTASPTSAAYIDIVNAVLELQPGIWELHYYGLFYKIGGPIFAHFFHNTDSYAAPIGGNCGGSGGNTVVCSMSWVVNISATTTYKVRANGTGDIQGLGSDVSYADDADNGFYAIRIG